MAASDLIDSTFADELEKTPVAFLPQSMPSPAFSAEQKTSNSIRTDLMELLGVPSLYDLDRLDLEVKSTIDGAFAERNYAALPRA